MGSMSVIKWVIALGAPFVWWTYVVAMEFIFGALFKYLEKLLWKNLDGS
jgi:hypothetical protein